MKVTSETIQSDASAWTALVEVRGVSFRAIYVAGRLSCSLAPYKHPPRVPRWCLDYVRRWAAGRVEALPPEWHAAHTALYGVSA